MPRIPDQNFRCCFFLFPTVDEAEQGAPVGGCGVFIGGIPWETKQGYQHVYAVTCEHLFRPKEEAAVVLRLGKKNTRGNIIKETRLDEWHFSEGDDLAVLHMSFGDEDDWSCEPIDRLLDGDTILSYDLGIGDEVFSIGRFLDIDGSHENRPVARFGNVSLLIPAVALDRPLGAPTATQDSYLVEMRSRTGFSGSPIFIYIPPETWPSLHTFRRVQSGKWFGPWLLGLHWGQLTVVGPGAGEGPLGGISGMVGVVPANRIKRFLLNDAELIRERQEIEAAWASRGDT